jgi:O-antigen/teichoic acid export membrane protein
VLYTTPYDLLRQVQFATYGIVTVMFPALGRAYGKGPDLAKKLYLRYMGVYFSLNALLFGMLALALPVALKLWLGETFANQALPTAWSSCLALFALSANVYFSSMMHTLGQARRETFLLLLEWPCYVALLIYGLKTVGIPAAPAVMALRLGVDSLLMHRHIFTVLKKACKVPLKG